MPGESRAPGLENRQQRLPLNPYMNKALARKDAMAHGRNFIKELTHLLGWVRR